MIKSKTAFVTFLILAIITFPYVIFYINSDFISSLVPGWNTVITPYYFPSVLAKFLILLIITILYWRLSKKINFINLKIFLFHVFLTIPAIITAKFSIYRFIDFDIKDSNKIINQFEIANNILILLNSIFLISQILFGIYILRIMKKFKKGNG